ncbi:MAG: nucleotide pyrophosphohydrolase [Anaerolineae bacterium]|jgi:NTP pyrophosphatase (non-canonical NTP hydrolase)
MADDKSLRELQQEVDEWIQTWGGGYWSPMSNLARIVEEVGEVARLLNDQFGEKPKKAGEPDQDLGMELTDIMYAIICLANSQGIDLQESFERMMEKYRTRDKYRYIERSLGNQ